MSPCPCLGHCGRSSFTPEVGDSWPCSSSEALDDILNPIRDLTPSRRPLHIHLKLHPHTAQYRPPSFFLSFLFLGAVCQTTADSQGSGLPAARMTIPSWACDGSGSSCNLGSHVRGLVVWNYYVITEPGCSWSRYVLPCSTACSQELQGSLVRQRTAAIMSEP